MLAKINRGTQLVWSLAKLPFLSSRVPEPEEAMEILEGLWPDSGCTCYLAEPVVRERRLDLSVIIPSYNNEQYVEACVRSVLDQQTTSSYEVIVVNDGSKDGTRQLLEKAFGEDPRVRLIHQENQGLSGARNTGIDLAAGRYLLFLDSDDRLLPGAVESLMTMALANDAGLVAGGYTCLFPDGRTTVGQVFGDGKAARELPGYAWGKVYKASLFDHLRFPGGYWFEDSISAQIIFPLCENDCYTVKECVCEYLMNPQGISAQAVKKPKSLDSLWLYRRLLRERELFGLTVTQGDYEHFLQMVRLTYSRTRGLSEEVKRSVFAMQIRLKQQYFRDAATSGGRLAQMVEQALVKGQYRRYCLAGELPL